MISQAHIQKCSAAGRYTRDAAVNLMEDIEVYTLVQWRKVVDKDDLQNYFVRGSWKN